MTMTRPVLAARRPKSGIVLCLGIQSLSKEVRGYAFDRKQVRVNSKGLKVQHLLQVACGLPQPGQ